MRSLHRAAAAVVFLVPMAVAPVAAQNYRGDIGINGGFGYWTDILKSEHTGVEEGVEFKAGWLAGAHLTGWITPRFGLRANLGYSERPLQMADDVELHGDVNLWSATGDLVFRFTREPARIGAREMMPYLALGVGAKWMNAAGENVTTTDPDGNDEEGTAFSIPGGNRFLLSEGAKLAGLAALGTDIRLARNFGLRLEFGDRFFDGATHLLDANNNIVEGDEDVGPVVHELYGILGLQFLFGIEPEVVAVTPAPPPPPPPAPAPAPPREESITVCVIDPTTGAGIRTVNAIYLPTEGDTLVVVNGQRRPIGTTVGNVMVASRADWFVAGRPLQVTAGGETVEFVTYGSSRLIDADDLAFLGTVDGLPVYADADDVADVREQIKDQIEAGNDLEEILEQRAELREELSEIDVVYTPLQPIGCVFQPLQRQEQVRKGR